MNLGEILDRTAQLYRTHFLLFAGISAVYAGLLLVLNLVQIGITQLLVAMHFTAGQQLWVTIGFLGVILPVAILAAGAAVAANNRAVAWVNLGQPATIRSAYESIWKRIKSYLWLMFLIQVIIYTPFVLLYGGLAYSLWKLGIFKPGFAQNPDPKAAMIMLGVLGVFTLLITLWAIYAILMGLRYSLAVPASVVESLKARQAMRRSIELSKGSRGRIFLLGLMIVFVEILLLIVPLGFVFIMTAKNHGVLPVWAQVLWQFVGFLVNTVIGPIYATGLTLFYYDQRIRKEGFDIEWMMAAAGLSWPPPWSGIEPGQAQPAPWAIAPTPAPEPADTDTLKVEVPIPPTEIAAPPEPAVEEPEASKPPGIEHEQH
jgi:hypothetical protein